jgi:hypothetical protein
VSGRWVEDDEKPKPEDVPENDSDLLNLYAEAIQAQEEEEASKQTLDEARQRTIDTRLKFLREKAAKHGFTPGAIFSLETETNDWARDPVNGGWILQPGTVLFPFCIVRGVSDYYDTGGRVFKFSNVMPNIEYSVRLKSGRWSVKIQTIWAPTLEQLEKTVRFL